MPEPQLPKKPERPGSPSKAPRKAPSPGKKMKKPSPGKKMKKPSPSKQMPRPETTKKPSKKPGKAQPAPVGTPRNPEVPSLTVQPDTESKPIEKPVDKRTSMEKMFGADDQPHFLSRSTYAQQQKQATHEKEIRTQASGPETRQDVESLDTLLARPTASQMGYTNPRPMYGQGSQSYFPQ